MEGAKLFTVIDSVGDVGRAVVKALLTVPSFKVRALVCGLTAELAENPRVEGWFSSRVFAVV